MLNDAVQLRLWNQNLSYLIEVLPDSFLQKRYNRDKWSVLENLAYLDRYQQVLQERIETILNEDRPVFGRCKAENDPLFTP